MKSKFNSQIKLFTGTHSIKLCVLILLTLGIIFTSCEESGSKPPKTYTITMEYDSETGTANVSPNPAAKGKMVTINAAPGSKYKFKSWTVVDGGITLTDNFTNPAEFTMPGKPVTIRAEFEPLSDVTLDNVEYGDALLAKRSIGIAGFGINTQTVSGVAMEQSDESPFVLDAADITNKLTIGNVISFFIQPRAGLKAGIHTDSVIISHGNGKTTSVSILITVSPKPLTIAGLMVANREYDGTTEAAISGTAELIGLVEGDDVELSDGTAAFEDKDAGTNKTVVFSDYLISGADAQNYILTQPQGVKADILPRSVTLVVTSPPSTTILIPFGAATVTYSGSDYQQNITLGFSVSGAIEDETVAVIVKENDFGLSGIDSGIPNTLNVSYDGTQVEHTIPVRVELNVTGNYQLNTTTSDQGFNIRINDGLTANRWLPVLNSNVAEFNSYAARANGLNRHYRLVENIILTKPQAGASNWTAIGTSSAEFSGSFNGNGFVIQNLTINRPVNNQGLFGVIAANAIVYNTALIDAAITGFNNVGGLTGMNYGTIQTSYVTGSVSGLNYIGGLAGINNGMIQNCYAASSVTGQQSVGGAAGIIEGTNGTVQYCYTMGSIKGNSYVGGIAGYVANYAKLINCVALNNRVTTETTGHSDIGRVVGAASQNLLVNNYARSTMIINKTNIVTGRNTTDGDIVVNYRMQSWWYSSLNWNVDSWDFTTMWQMNEKNLPKLRNVGGSQNHELVFSPDEVWIPAGSFTMGSPAGEYERNEDEGPQHTVNLNGFYIGKYEVTILQYTAVMSTIDYSDFSLSGINWYEALVFCNRLSILENLSPAYRINNSTDPKEWGSVPTSADPTWDAVEIVAGSNGYRLPTEAQWEYACRAGISTAYATGGDYFDGNGWYVINSYRRGTPNFVGLTQPNAWGIYDMHGNVSEWCWDWYGAYTGNILSDPLGPSSGTARIHRGGNSHNEDIDVRSAKRFQFVQYEPGNLLGIRLVCP